MSSTPPASSAVSSSSAASTVSTTLPPPLPTPMPPTSIPSLPAPPPSLPPSLSPALPTTSMTTPTISVPSLTTSLSTGPPAPLVPGTNQPVDFGEYGGLYTSVVPPTPLVATVSMEEPPVTLGYTLVGEAEFKLNDGELTKGGAKRACFGWKLSDGTYWKIMHKVTTRKNFSNKANITQYERGRYLHLIAGNLVIVVTCEEDEKHIKSKGLVGLNYNPTERHPLILLSSQTRSGSIVRFYHTNPEITVDVNLVKSCHESLSVQIFKIKGERVTCSIGVGFTDTMPTSQHKLEKRKRKLQQQNAAHSAALHPPFNGQFPFLNYTHTTNPDGIPHTIIIPTFASALGGYPGAPGTASTTTTSATGELIHPYPLPSLISFDPNASNPGLTGGTSASSTTSPADALSGATQAPKRSKKRSTIGGGFMGQPQMMALYDPSAPPGAGGSMPLQFMTLPQGYRLPPSLPYGVPMSFPLPGMSFAPGPFPSPPTTSSSSSASSSSLSSTSSSSSGSTLSTSFPTLSAQIMAGGLPSFAPVSSSTSSALSGGLPLPSLGMPNGSPSSLIMYSIPSFGGPGGPLSLVQLPSLAPDLLPSTSGALSTSTGASMETESSSSSSAVDSKPETIDASAPSTTSTDAASANGGSPSSSTATTTLAPVISSSPSASSSASVSDSAPVSAPAPTSSSTGSVQSAASALLAIAR